MKKQFAQQNDQTLVELTLLGDDSAYEELVTRHQRAVMGTAYKETGNSFSAQDAAQDAFVSAWMNLSSLHDGAKFGSWVNAIAKNSARTLMTRYRSTIPSLSLDLLSCGEPEENDSEWNLLAEDYTDLHEAVESLGEKLRETIRLHYFEDRSVSEIALLLGVPEGTVKWRLSEGRKQLRKGYGIMEKTYDENETITTRVMRQVEELKLWRLKNDKTGFEADFRCVLQNVEALGDSKEKNAMLADTLLLGWWWLPGEKNKETFARIKKAAWDGHNDDVMQEVAAKESDPYSGDAKINFMKDTQIPLYRENHFPKTLAWTLFWLGYEYYGKGEYANALPFFEEVTRTLPPTEVYHATALTAIDVLRRLIAQRSAGNTMNLGLGVCGESYQWIGQTLCFFEQPGFSSGYFAFGGDCNIFYDMGACDSIILDAAMKVGGSRVSSDGKVTLRYTENKAVCDTPAGHFENCSVFVCSGERYGNQKYVETILCPGVGVVSQTATVSGETWKWVLSDCRIVGGEGLLPFAVGNRWSYTEGEKDETHIAEKENVYTVTGCENGKITTSSFSLCLPTGYSDTWEGKTLEVREQYYDEQDQLRDVSAAMERCEELAKTKRQKIHTAVANKVMRRIFSGDPVLHPDAKERGMWNFFEYNQVTKEAGAVTIENNRTYSFEWKDGFRGNEGNKVYYSFFMTILQEAAGCVWSDRWIDGYHDNEKGKTKDFCVTDGETVTTPSGVFENCRHIRFDYQARERGYFSGISHYWYAPGIGIVRFEHPFGDHLNAVWVLTEYRGRGEGYFPTDDGIFRRYAPESLGEGWHASAEFTFDTDENGTILFKDTLGTRDSEMC